MPALAASGGRLAHSPMKPRLPPARSLAPVLLLLLALPPASCGQRPSEGESEGEGEVSDEHAAGLLRGLEAQFPLLLAHAALPAAAGQSLLARGNSALPHGLS